MLESSLVSKNVMWWLAVSCSCSAFTNIKQATYLLCLTVPLKLLHGPFRLEIKETEVVKDCNQLFINELINFPLASGTIHVHEIKLCR